MIINILLFLIFFMPPIIINSYITTFLLFIVTIVSYLIVKNNIVYKINCLIILIFLLSFLTVFNTIFSYYFSSLWNFRDIVRPFLLFLVYLFIMNYNIKEESFLKKIKVFFLFFIFIEGILSLLYIYDRNLISFLNIYNNFNDIRVEKYWRFIGLFGNPNFDGMILGYGVL